MTLEELIELAMDEMILSETEYEELHEELDDLQALAQCATDAVIRDKGVFKYIGPPKEGNK